MYGLEIAYVVRGAIVYLAHLRVCQSRGIK